MIKRTLLNVNFSDEENTLIQSALEKTDVDVNVNKATLKELSSSKSSMANVSLVLIKFNGSLSMYKFDLFSTSIYLLSSVKYSF